MKGKEHGTKWKSSWTLNLKTAWATLGIKIIFAVSLLYCCGHLAQRHLVKVPSVFFAD